MKCDVCRFDMGEEPTESGKCWGCGTPLWPSSEQSRPGPGIHVSEHEEPFIVTDELRRRDPKLENRFIIYECDMRWGRGIGAETYGYYIKKLSEVVRTEAFADGEEACPECGDDRALHEYGFDGCVASYARLHCNTCDHEFYNHFDC